MKDRPIKKRREKNVLTASATTFAFYLKDTIDNNIIVVGKFIVAKAEFFYKTAAAPIRHSYSKCLAAVGQASKCLEISMKLMSFQTRTLQTDVLS